jgi:hypothetical protein
MAWYLVKHRHKITLLYYDSVRREVLHNMLLNSKYMRNYLKQLKCVCMRYLYFIQYNYGLLESGCDKLKA